MEQYWTDVPLPNVRVAEIGDLIEKLREQGTAELNVSGKIPMFIRVMWDVGEGPDTAFNDLWDLRGYIEELSSELSDYDVPAIGKPELVR